MVGNLKSQSYAPHNSTCKSIVNARLKKITPPAPKHSLRPHISCDYSVKAKGSMARGTTKHIQKPIRIAYR